MRMSRYGGWPSAPRRSRPRLGRRSSSIASAALLRLADGRCCRSQLGHMNSFVVRCGTARPRRLAET
eukprot:15600455-Heterocapsa_arctica.AAC.1